MHPRCFAVSTPSKPAVVMAGSGAALSYLELEQQANRAAHLFRSIGLVRGDGVAILSRNNPSFFVCYWAAMRSGLYVTTVATHLTTAEAAYIVNDSGARILLLAPDAGPVAADLCASPAALTPQVVAIYGVGGAIGEVEALADAAAGYPDTPITDEQSGAMMFYSSGTTGRQKGVRQRLPATPIDAETTLETRLKWQFEADAQTVYLSPAPLYHAAPLSYSAAVQRLGGTVIVMERFDPEGMLAAIERHRVSLVQLVPTMFVRMLKLPPDVRARYDLSSLRHAVHAAAPCPAAVKRQMLDWWGPIISEYYSASEAVGQTFITAAEWLERPGSVGRANGAIIHICDEAGREVPSGEIGTIFFESANSFVYHNDPQKTAASRHPAHPDWSRIGDLGYVDDDGYLFLTGRHADMIISGGVNIYPEEIEHVLILHPAVADVAVFGVPDEDMGEEVKAVVKPRDWAASGPALAAELQSFCRTHISAVKCPRSIDFERELPRHDTGKLFKRLLKDRYRSTAAAR